MRKSKLLKAICRTILETDEVVRDALSDYGDAARYASTDAYYRAVRGAMANNGLVLLPGRMSVSGKSDHSYAIREFILEHVGGETRTIPAPPWPLYDDSPEKASDKALMGAALKAQMRSVLGELLLLPQEIAIPLPGSWEGEPQASDAYPGYEEEPSLEEVVGPHPFGRDEPSAAPKAKSRALEKMRAAIEAKGRISFQGDSAANRCTRCGNSWPKGRMPNTVDGLCVPCREAPVQDSMSENPADPSGLESPEKPEGEEEGVVPVDANDPEGGVSTTCTDAYREDCKGSLCASCGFCQACAWEANRQGEGRCLHCTEIKPGGDSDLTAAEGGAPEEEFPQLSSSSGADEVNSRELVCRRCEKATPVRLGVCRGCWDADKDPMQAMVEMDASA